MWTFENIIVGAGPTGLTVAYYLSLLKKQVLLIDREQEIGGLHRVRRVNNQFTEHGPRIYVGSYVNFNRLLEEMGGAWHDFFTPMFLNPIDAYKDIKGLSLRESFLIISNLFRFLFSSSYQVKCNQTSVEDFAQSHQFTEAGLEVLDRLCRTTDGAGAKRYTLYEFFMILNQNALYRIFQPRFPNDDPRSFVMFWKRKLIEKGVTIWSGKEVTQILASNGRVESLGVQEQNSQQKFSIKASENCIFAIPPTDFLTLLNRSHLFPSPVPKDFGQWVDGVKYKKYLPITFHWDHFIPLPSKLSKVAAPPEKSPWAIGHIVLSNYWDTHPSETVISTAIMRLNQPSHRTGKTANQSSMAELKDEVWHFLKNQYPSLPLPSLILASPEIFWDTKENKWNTIDQSFVRTKYGFFGPRTNFSNLFWVNTGNGKSNYAFTSLESAVQNGISFVQTAEPSLELTLLKPQWTLKNVLLVVFSFLLIFLVYRVSWSRAVARKHFKDSPKRQKFPAEE